MRVSNGQLVVLALASMLSMGGVYGQGKLSSAPSGIGLATGFISHDLQINIKGTDGKPVPGQISVQLVSANGQPYDRMTARNGQARFNRLPKSEFRLLVNAPGYQPLEKRVDLANDKQLATVSLQLRPLSDAEDAASARSLGALDPRTQKEVGKALEALRTEKPNNAFHYLEAAERDAPNNPEIEYLFGVYCVQTNDGPQALAHWKTALTLDPKHLSSLLEMGQELLHEKKAAEAVPYLQRAMEAEPSSWRAHALLAEADYTQRKRDEAITEAERALELGQGRAASLEPFLAALVAERGDKARAIQILQAHLKSNPRDAAAGKELEELKNPGGAANASVGDALKVLPASATALPLPSSWMPSDVDEKVPPVETGAACPLDEVLKKTGERLVELVHDVNRFTATEWVSDQTINKWGVSSPAEKRKFSYLVSIEEIRPGMLSVDEYRDAGGGSTEMPNGVITSGLPALVLIFHPFYASNYDMTCEGLGKWNGNAAWQVHFRQRADKPVLNRGFRVGMFGPLNPAALRGRAWISVENDQIVRLETDLVAPMPQVKMVAEHTVIEYGAVNFQKENVNLWLPHSAEVYFDWQGQRVHRRHNFDNYMLFSVDEQERIGKPTSAEPADDSAGSGKNHPPS
ncbi:MAG TPA: tetratricopeptide repeat protein [Verrucomicrobiae bacterium]|nr:tetratricopeptide repeat protein [Verrucomicrobiae bacterium]